MTLISWKDVPDDIWKRVMYQTIISAQDISIYRLVCTNFNRMASDKVFLQTLVVKIKGDQYSDPIYSHDPRKFFNLDGLITRAFKSIFADNSANYDDNVKQWKDITTIALKNLDMGLFYLTRENLNIRYFICSNELIKQLQELDFTYRDKWQKCINTIANSIATAVFPVQLEIRYPRPYLRQISSAFNHPNAKLMKIIIDHEITKVYFTEPSVLVIEHMKDIELRPLQLQEAVLSPEEHKQKLNHELIQDFFHNLKYELVGNQIHFIADEDRKESLLKRLKDTSTGQKAHFDEYYSRAPSLFIFGHLFPEIWPNVIKNMLHEDSRDAVNYWLVTLFKKSIHMTTTETEDTKEFVRYDPDLKNLILERLKDPSCGLKADIEEKCTEKFLQSCKVIFPEIWPN